MPRYTKKELLNHYDDRFVIVCFANGYRYGFHDFKNILEALQLQMNCSRLGESCYVFSYDYSAKVWEYIDQNEKNGARLTEKQFTHWIRKLRIPKQ